MTISSAKSELLAVNMPLTASASAVEARPIRVAGADSVSPMAVTILVLWLGCLGIGLLGMALPYVRPQPAPAEPPPIQAEVLDVELIPDTFAPTAQEALAPLNITEPPPPVELTQPVEPPPLLAVARPDKTIAFPLPVETPARVVERESADITMPVAEPSPAPIAAPSPQVLTYGQGEGNQPAPAYPRQAVRQGQEGVVVIRFSVGANGRVLAAEAISPSPWPMLNEAALKAVRERWRFRSGNVRVYDVSIRFELKK